MRLRSLVPWVLVPPLLCVLLAAWFVNRAVADERAEMEGFAQESIREDVMFDASAWVASETTTLMSFDAFTHVPPGLALFANANEAYSALDVDSRLLGLRNAEGGGPKTLRQLRVVGGTVPAVEQVLSPLDETVYDDLRSGRTAFIDPTPYLDAYDAITAETTTSDVVNDDAVLRLGDVIDRPPFWQDRRFVTFAIAVGGLTIAGAVILLLRISGAQREAAARVARAEERSEQSRRVITAARRLSSASDFPSMAQALLTELRDLVGGDLATLVIRDEARLEPVAVKGSMRPIAIASGDGTVGRCVDTGATQRVVVPADPMLPDVEGPLAVLATPLVDGGQVIGAVVVASQAAQMFDEGDEATLQMLALLAAGATTAAQRFESTVALALRDPLTGLANRRRLDHDLTTAAVSEAEVAFLMIDIDHFKSFNDRHGHQRGDELLRLVADALTGAVRTDDVVYRYGGEEFCVLLPGTDTATATVVAERVRESVTQASASAGEPVTVSVGVASQAAPVEPAALVERADAALYDAKRSGRDRVVPAR